MNKQTQGLLTSDCGALSGGCIGLTVYNQGMNFSKSVPSVVVNLFCILKNISNFIDFQFEGNTRLRAVSVLWRVYPNYSVQRKVLKLLNALNQLSVMARVPNMKILDNREKSLPELSSRQSRAFLLHKVNQNGRVYIFDQDQYGQLTSVTKMAINEVAAEGLHREHKVLKSLVGKTAFIVPKILQFDSWDGGCLLRMSAAPHDQLTHDKRQPIPDALFEEVARLRPLSAPKRLRAGSIKGWQVARTRSTTPLICAIASQIDPSEKFEVTAAHGDLGSENIFSIPSSQEVGDFTIIDWEFFSETAPLMTDRVGVWLGRHHRAFKSWGPSNINELAARFLTDFETTPGGKHAAVLALLHLAEMDIDLACYLTGDR